jgi:hypothetical protein
MFEVESKVCAKVLHQEGQIPSARDILHRLKVVIPIPNQTREKQKIRHARTIHPLDRSVDCYPRNHPSDHERKSVLKKTKSINARRQIATLKTHSRPMHPFQTPSYYYYYTEPSRKSASMASRSCESEVIP